MFQVGDKVALRDSDGSAVSRPNTGLPWVGRVTRVTSVKVVCVKWEGTSFEQFYNEHYIHLLHSRGNGLERMVNLCLK